MFPLVKLALLAATLMFVGGCRPGKDAPGEITALPGEVQLPSPSYEGQYPLEAVLTRRFSGRNFREQPLSLTKLAQLLWAAQGIPVDALTGATRTAPSAGATYPLEVYLVAGNVTDLPAGIYHYHQKRHTLVPVAVGDYRTDLAASALRQDFLAAAPASIILTADYARTTRRYGERGVRYVHMEIGHATQNMLLQAEAINLGSVAVGAFHDDKLKMLLKTEYAPLIIVPVGYLK